MLLPLPLILTSLFGLVSVIILFVSGGLLYKAYRRYEMVRKLRLDRHANVAPTSAATREGDVLPVAGQDRNRTRTKLPPREVLADRAVWAPLIIGLALLMFTFWGRLLVQLAFRSGDDNPTQLHSNVAQDIDGPDGTRIHVESFGRSDAPILVFTNGWSTSNTEWYYAKRQLSNDFRLIFWDIPGLGASRGPQDRDFRLETMARELKAVVSLANGGPVVLVGHSIGGMINLTYCRLFPNQLGNEIAGIVQVDTSYTNPVKTTKNAPLNEALQKPVAEPLLHAITVLSPLVRAMNWLSYQNGTAHIVNAQSSFAGSETWGQVDLIARYGYESSPEVVARGTLAMFHWDATPELTHIIIPVLILIGQEDTTTLPSASVFMQKAIPHAELKPVSPSAHYGLLEQNATYNQFIGRFASVCLLSSKSAR